MLPSQTAEIKQQAIIEKAQDPDSSVSPAAAKEAIVEESRKAGAAAFQFDPNATTAEKAAQIKAQIPPGVKPELKSKQPAALVTDADKGPPQYNLPPATKAGAIDPKDVPPAEEEDEDEKFWRVVGGRPRIGYNIPADLDMNTNLLDHQTWLEDRLQDKFYGDWYYNAGVIIFASLSSWLIAVLGGGLGWVFLVMAICGTYYRTSLRRVRRNFRDDIRRDLAKTQLETDHESLEWINSFLVKFWPIYSKVLSNTIVQSVDQVLSVATPPMVESLKLTTFELGTKPPRMEHVKTYPKTEDDIVLMDWKFSFNPNDTIDMTSRQLKVKVNPKVVLTVRIGIGMMSKGLDVIVEDMACEGIIRLKVKLQTEFPHVDRIEFCFLERPVMDYVCKPLGGDTFGADINFIPGLQSFIMEQVHGNLGPMMYAPNVFPIEIAKLLAGSPVDQAIGVVQVTFHGAQGLKNPDQFSGTPDPYALVKINEKIELGRTKVVKENANPRWNETIHILVTSLTDTLNIHVFDFNDIRKDRELGEATFALDRLNELDEHENEQLDLTSNGKARGCVTADIRYFPVLGPTKLDDGTMQPPPETMTGVIRFTVDQAKDLDGSKSRIGYLNPYAVLLLNGKEVHVSEKLKRTNKPVWAKASKEILITDRRTAKLGLVIKDDRDIEKDPVIASYNIKLEDILEMQAKHVDWYNLSGDKHGRVKMKVDWRPVNLKGAFGGSGGYITPIGVMRIHCKNARELRNLETVGKSDPYLRALLSGVQKSRTVTWKNNLNPDFDEVLYVPVHSIREKLTLEIMDEEKMGKDRSLGHLEIPLKDYIHQSEEGEYLVNDSKEMLARTLQFGPGKTPKGTLNFSCSFFPTVPTADPDEEERDKAEAEADGRVSLDSQPPRQSMESMKTAGSQTPRTPITPVQASKEFEKATGRPRSGTNTSQNGSAGLERTLTKDTTPEFPKLRITADNLIDYGVFGFCYNHDMKSGLLIFTILDGDFVRTNCHLEVLMDDHVFASYSSSKVKNRKHEFNETGDAMVRELDQSRITLRLVEHIDKEGKGGEDKDVASLSGPTLQTLQRCLYTATPLTLRDDHGHESRVNVKLKFIPIKMKLDPSESFRNMGKLRVDVLEGANLPAADRNGYSDPYLKFFLNDKEVHKTEKKDKTLNPKWSEHFELAVRSRTAAKFEVHCFDWDMGSSDDFLGKGKIDLASIEPYMRKDVTIPLDGKSGTIRLRLLFTPDWISRSRQGSSTFHGTFSGVGKVAGAPVKGVTKGVTAVGGGVGKTASFLGKSFRRRKSRAGSEFDPEELDVDGGTSTPPPLPLPLPTGSAFVDGENGSPATSHTRNVSNSAAASRLSFVGMSGQNGAYADSGYANISVLGASGFPPSSDIRIYIRLEGSGKSGKEIIKTKVHKASSGEVKFEGESTRVQCGADATFRVLVVDHHTFGSDDELGEGTFHVSDQGSGSETQVHMTKGEGTVTIRSSFEVGDKASIKEKSHRWKRDSRERSATPGA